MKSADGGIARLRRELARPEAYPMLPERVECIETHISLVFLAGERVYKLKKPLDLGFLDFSTLERREHFCREELRLNRRLAPGIYLDVLPVVEQPDGHLRVGGPGRIVDWAVEMQRLPEHRMLDRLLERGEIDNALLNELCALLARFHAAAATGPGVDEHGSPAAIAAAVDQNFEQLLSFAGNPAAPAPAGFELFSSEQHVFLRTHARGFLATQRELFERRVRAGRIRECHGDLHARNLCFPASGPVAYDCLEFDPALRCIDVASELAFLAMDLDRHGFPAFARYLVHRYGELAQDAELPLLVDFYKGYRAVVRGKVAALAALGAAGERRAELVREARGYLQLALGYELRPALVLLCGLPASGKSTLAPELARALRAVLLHSDLRRKQLAGLEPSQPGHADYGQGLYTPEQKRRTYRSLLDDAVAALESRRPVVVDASFSERAFRAPFVDAAARLELPYCLVLVEASEAETRARLARARGARTGSDADLAVYLRARERFEPPDELPGGHVLRIDSNRGTPEDACALLLDRLIALERPP